MRASTALRSTLLALTTVASPRDDLQVKTVTRSYGGGVVRQDDRDQRLRINFRGKRGDLVTVISNPFPGSPGCERTSLVRLDKDRVIRQRRSGLWRLPKNGRFTITYRQDCYQAVGNDDTGSGEYRANVQLTKVVPHPLTAGGAPVDLKLDRGYLHAGVAFAVQPDRTPSRPAVDGAAYGAWRHLRHLGLRFVCPGDRAGRVGNRPQPAYAGPEHGADPDRLR